MVEDFRVDGIGLHQPVVIMGLVGLGGHLRPLRRVSIGEGAADGVAAFEIPNRLEEAAADDLEGFLDRDRLPERWTRPKVFSSALSAAWPRELPASRSDSGREARRIAVETSLVASVRACTKERLLS